MEQPDQPEARSRIREVSLLPGEEVVSLLSEAEEAVSEAPPEGSLLVLTTRRLLLFSERDGESETMIVPLESLQGASIKMSARSTRPLVQGAALVITALAAYLLIGTFISGVIIAAIVGAIIGVIGVFMILRYVFWEGEGSLTFQASGWTASFPHQGRHRSDLFRFVDAFFRLKAGDTPVRTSTPSRVARAREMRPVLTPAPAVQEAESPLQPEQVRGTEAASPEDGDDEPRRGLADTGVGDDVQG